MNSDNYIRVITCDHHPDPLAFDLANIAPVASCFGFHPDRVADHELRIRLSQSLLPQLVLRMPREIHGPLRAGHLISLPL
jgi:hypothetical protein